MRTHWPSSGIWWKPGKPGHFRAITDAPPQSSSKRAGWTSRARFSRRSCDGEVLEADIRDGCAHTTRTPRSHRTAPTTPDGQSVRTGASWGNRGPSGRLRRLVRTGQPELQPGKVLRSGQHGQTHPNQHQGGVKNMALFLGVLVGLGWAAAIWFSHDFDDHRSEERRVGKECRS